LPDVSPAEVIALLEHLHQHGHEEELVAVAENTHKEFARVVLIVNAAEMLALIDTPLNMVVLTAEGKRFVEATPEERPPIWRKQLLTLWLFQEVYDVVQREPDHAVDADFVLETIVQRMPYENFEKVFNTFVRWARFGDLFVYDQAAQTVKLSEAVSPPLHGGAAPR
jgi:NitT/TauT family transport system ATP-binding protein